MAASIFPPVFEGDVKEGIKGEDGSGGVAQAVTVTIDDGSVVVIRRLSCGVLFISSSAEGKGAVVEEDIFLFPFFRRGKLR